MLAVVGLCGGAGATTIAYLTAAGAALESTRPVLLADLGGPAASVAAYAGFPGGLSFAALAGFLQSGQRPPRSPFTPGQYGMRLLAGSPDLDEPVDEAAAAALLEQAAAAHALTVLDCAQLARPVERVALAHATHVAWVLPASRVALRRGKTLLRAAANVAVGREMILARHDRSVTSGVMDALSDLAEERAAALVLVPLLDEISENGLGLVLDQAALTLQAIGGALHR